MSEKDFTLPGLYWAMMKYKAEDFTEEALGIVSDHACPYCGELPGESSKITHLKICPWFTRQ